MKKNAITETKKEQLIQAALRTAGYVFPQTVEEVEAFEKYFGTTDISMPVHLKVPSFLNKSRGKKLGKVISQAIPVNFAAAAREGAPKLSDEVRKKMHEDRKKADSQKNNKQ
ncbi:MAG: hypothetical protein V4717_21110 [Bacteroidota bacterium]